MITTGSHLLFGQLTLASDLETVRNAWLDAVTQDAYDRRDARWWAEEVACVDGPYLFLLEDETRTSRGQLARIEAFVDAFAAGSSAGQVVLQHVESGVAVTEWQVHAGGVDKARSTRKRPRRIPAGFSAFRPRLQAMIDAHTAAWNARTPPERFAEVLDRQIPRLNAVVLEGGDPAVRSEALRQVAAAMGGGPGVVQVAELDTLPHDAQLDLVRLLAETEVRVLATLSQPARAAVASGALHPALHLRISAGLLDLHAVHP